MHRVACERGGRIGGSPHAAGFANPNHSAGFLIAALSTEDLVAARRTFSRGNPALGAVMSELSRPERIAARRRMASRAGRRRAVPRGPVVTIRPRTVRPFRGEKT